jgi:uncharacterized protein YigE (DUF2233 family)
MKPIYIKEYLQLAKGGVTSYRMIFSRAAWEPVIVRPGEDLPHWSREKGISYAISGGFFVHHNILREKEKVGDPLGQFWLKGEKQKTFPFKEPWGSRRGSFNSRGDLLEIDAFAKIRKPYNLLQAGPLLVKDGKMVDFSREGFCEDRIRFDSDITAARHPRAAIGISDNEIIVFACDGRREGEAGMYLEEVAEKMLDLGASDALNLDGGGSVSFIYDGQEKNTPAPFLPGADPLPQRVPSPTAIAFLEK